MKIGDKSVSDCALAGGLEAGTGRVTKGTATSRADSVQVSDVARALTRLMGSVEVTALDPARAAQVSILRNAVLGDRYQPDLRDVASKLLTEVAAEIAG